jgi:hypothetical protein
VSQAGRLAYISEFIDEAKASGVVQQAIARVHRPPLPIPGPLDLGTECSQFVLTVSRGLRSDLKQETHAEIAKGTAPRGGSAGARPPAVEVSRQTKEWRARASTTSYPARDPSPERLRWTMAKIRERGTRPVRIASRHRIEEGTGCLVLMIAQLQSVEANIHDERSVADALAGATGW